MTVTWSSIFIPRGSSAVNRHPVTIWGFTGKLQNFEARADGDAYVYKNAVCASGYADVNAEKSPESDADLPEDVDDGHVEVTGQKEVLSRRRQKLVNE